MVCADPAPPTSGLRKWVARLTPAKAVVPVLRRRPLALPAGPTPAPPAPVPAGPGSGVAGPDARELERV